MIYPFKQYKYQLFKFMLVAMLAVTGMTHSYTQDLDYRAQSLYIYKFTRYIQWPEGKTSGDFKIGVFGNSPIIEELNLMASLKTAGNDQKITVSRISQDDDMTGYHLIYIAASKSRQIGFVSDQVSDLPVLVVAEREGMANRGATISFLVTEADILKFEVNTSRLESQKLDISEDLIKLGYKL